MTAVTGTALIVDDEPGICWALERMLGSLGYSTVTAQTGREACELAACHDIRLALVDAKLPDTEGSELAVRLRRIRPGLPVVLLSGYFNKDDDAVKQWVADGLVCAFVGKPFSSAEIRDAIDAAELLLR